MNEKDFEITSCKRIKKELEEKGFTVKYYKLGLGVKGFPDRTFFVSTPNFKKYHGVAFSIEFKTPSGTGRISQAQKLLALELEKVNHQVFFLSNKLVVGHIIQEISDYLRCKTSTKN